jgi:radical SAM protein with 4Fe4S-binding SPASM domain
MKTALYGRPTRSLLSSFSTFRQSPKSSFPFKLKIECSAICNLKCAMCPHSEKIGLKRKKGYLKFKNFKKVFDEIKPAYLNLTGIGEPFLNPDLFEIIKYAKKNKAMVKLDTNLTLLNKENIRKILDTKINIISTSIDGTTKKSYEKIRIGSNFELIKKNIKNLVKYRNKINSLCEIHMFFVLQENNIKELPDFIKFAEELGVDYIAGSFVVTLGNNKNNKNKIFNYKGDVKKLINKTKKLIKNSKIEISINPLLEYLESSKNKEFYNEKFPCYMPWYSTFITWDGDVNPCDFSCDNEIVFGNAFRTPFKKIWNNKKYKKFRRELLKSRKNIKICKECSVDETYLKKEINKIKKIPFIKLLQHKNSKND